jgi:hypothetical protein
VTSTNRRGKSLYERKKRKIFIRGGGNYISMTLVQASIANDGKTIIIVADRLLTSSFGRDFPDYESEGANQKIYLKGNIGVGFAGSALYSDMAISEVSSLSITDFNETVKKISEFVKKQRENIINNEVVRVTGITSKDFFESSEKVPEAVRGYVYGWRNDFRFNFQCIVAGFDKDKNSGISYITNEGDIISVTNFGVGSIGSGAPFSEIYFDQCNYDISMPEIESLFFAYKAKRWAEAPTGVGLRTDILILRKDASPINIRDEDNLMKELRGVYNKEKEKASKIRENLLKLLIKNNFEVLR